MYARRIRRALALLAVATGTLAGCSDSVNFPADLAGTFNLTTADGHALPYTLPGTPAGTTVVLAGGTLVLLDNGRFDEVLFFILTNASNPGGLNTAAETIGDVSVSGGQITFSPRFESSYSGTISANNVTYSKAANGSTSISLSWTRGS